MMLDILALVQEALVYVYNSLVHNALFLILGVVIAAVITVHVDPEKFKAALLKRSNVSLAGSVAFGAFTPFCACGTMAVIVAMMASALPWGPVMAFLTSSPLMSPDEFVMISGILGTKFAVALTAASIIIGMGSGYITHYIEKNTDFLKGQIRLDGALPAESCCGAAQPAAKPAGSCCAKSKPAPVAVACCAKTEPEPAVSAAVTDCCGGAAVAVQDGFWARLRLGEMVAVVYEVGVKKVLLNFAAFSAVAYMINKYIPTDLIAGYLGAGNVFAVLVSALAGLPLYMSGVSSIPLIDMLMKNGASGGAMLAFMITGPGTSAGVIAGIATIMKGRAVSLYVAFLLVWSIVLGYAYDLLLMIGL